MKLFIFALLPAAALCQLGGLVGGITQTTVDLTDEPVVFAAQKANEFLTSSGQLAGSLALTQVLSARTQVVAGQKLYLTLKLGQNYVCDVTVWYRAWLQGDLRLQVTDGPTCVKAVAKRQAGGVSGAHPLTSAPAEVTKALDFAVCALNAQSNSMNFAVVGDTSAVTYTQQVTAGMTYVFSNVPVEESGCRKSGQCQAATLQACQIKAHGMKNSCTLTVQWQAWMDPAYTLTSMKC